MRLLHAGVDITMIALWLGHESTDTTQIYLHADLALKERALDRTTPPDTRPGRYRPPDTAARVPREPLTISVHHRPAIPGRVPSRTRHCPSAKRSRTVKGRPDRAERSEPRSGALDGPSEAELPAKTHR